MNEKEPEFENNIEQQKNKIEENKIYSLELHLEGIHETLQDINTEHRDLLKKIDSSDDYIEQHLLSEEDKRSLKDLLEDQKNKSYELVRKAQKKVKALYERVNKAAVGAALAGTLSMLGPETQAQQSNSGAELSSTENIYELKDREITPEIRKQFNEYREGLIEKIEQKKQEIEKTGIFKTSKDDWIQDKKNSLYETYLANNDPDTYYMNYNIGIDGNLSLDDAFMKLFSQKEEQLRDDLHTFYEGENLQEIDYNSPLLYTSEYSSDNLQKLVSGIQSLAYAQSKLEKGNTLPINTIPLKENLVGTGVQEYIQSLRNSYSEIEDQAKNREGVEPMDIVKQKEAKEQAKALWIQYHENYKKLEERILSLKETMTAESFYKQHDERRAWVLENLQSPTYKERLLTEGYSDEEANAVIQKRAYHLMDKDYIVDFENLDNESMWDHEDDTVKFHPEKATQYEQAIHEFSHDVIQGDQVSETLKEKFTQGVKNMKDIDDEFLQNKFTYFSNFRELYPRKKKLDAEMEELGIKRYEEEFTEDHYEQLQDLYKKDKLSKNSREIFIMMKKEALINIMNTVASVENNKGQSHSSTA